MNKIKKYYRSLSFGDFLRKVVYYFLQRRRSNIGRKLKALYYFKSRSILLGKGVRIQGLPMDVSIGSNTAIYDHCVFEFSHGSRLSVGTNVVFSYGVVLSCRREISIGNDVQIGEYSSLRDSTHDYTVKDKAIKYGNDTVSPIQIANNVWIGRACLIMPGTVIEEGVVIAANSVVKGHLKRDSIYGGCPVRFIKNRI